MPKTKKVVPVEVSVEAPVNEVKSEEPVAPKPVSLDEYLTTPQPGDSPAKTSLRKAIANHKVVEEEKVKAEETRLRNDPALIAQSKAERNPLLVNEYERNKELIKTQLDNLQ